MPRGVTLLELLLVLVGIALLSLMAMPRVASVASRLALRREAAALVDALDQARITAIQFGGVSTLTLRDSSYLVTAGMPPDTAGPWRRAGPATRGIQLTGAGAPIQFGGAGLAIGVANRTLTLSRNGVSRRVVISRLGRITP